MIMTWNINLFFLIDVFLSAARWLFYVLYLLFTMFFILYAFIFKGCIIRRRRKFWWFHAVVLQKTAKKSTRLKTHVLKYCPAHEISFFFFHDLVAVAICESPPVIKRAVLPKAAIYHFCHWFLYPWGACTMKYVAVRKSCYLMWQENRGRRENFPHFSL